MIESGYIAAPLSGAQVEGLQVLEVLGERGATSVGYRVTDGERMLFMKRLRPELLGDEGMRMAFRKEYEVGCRVHSPHVVRYVDFYESDDDVYVLMEYVAGKTLLDKVRGENQNISGENQNVSGENGEVLSIEQVRTWFVQLLEGLHALHSEGIVHLDIKPDNLLISDVNQRLVIADLGYCHQDSYLAPVGRTRDYAAPELSGKGTTINVRADIYSAGRVLQKMLASLEDQSSSHPLPEWGKEVVAKCCAENPCGRYASVDEVLDALHSFRHPAARPKRWRWVLLSILALLLASSAYVWHASRGIIRDEGVVLRVLSEDSMTCEVIGPVQRYVLGRVDCMLQGRDTALPTDVVIHPTVTHDGRTYRVVSIADSAFIYMPQMRAITLPMTLRHIGAGAFKDCKGLTSVTLPDSLESFGGLDVFQNCEGLETVRLPKGLRTMAPHMFVHCLELKELVFPDSLKVLPEHAFMSCKSLTEVRIPAGVRTIERGVFWDCQQLKRVYLSGSVETIADFAFGQCPELKDVYVEWPRPIIVADIFARSHPRIHVPRGAADLYRAAPVWKDYEIVEE